MEQTRYDGDVRAYHEIERIYDRAIVETEKEIRAWYNRFAKNNEISLADANKLLSDKELAELKWDVQQYINRGRENAIDQKWMKELENASARYHISRLESIKLQIQQRAESVMGSELDILDKRVRDVYSDTYYHTAYEIQRGTGVGYTLDRIDQRRIDAVIQKPWAVDGSNFSDRIWDQRDKLVNTLHQELTQSIIRGEDPERAIAALANTMGNSKTNARRLIMTESAAMASRSQQDCYKDLDVEKYKIVATLDDLTCDICGGLDGHVFKMSEYQVGTSAPPFHPNCRTVTVPFFEDDTNAVRAARGKDGKTYHVPANTQFKEWKDAMIDGGDNPFMVNPEPKVVEPPKPESQPDPLKYTFVESKTIEDAQKYAMQFVGSGYAPHFKNIINFKGISIEHANEINRALTDVFNALDLPPINGIATVSPTSAVGKKAFKSGADALFSYSFAEGGIYINKDILKNPKAFEEYKKRSKESWDLVMDNLDRLSKEDREKALLYKTAGRSLVDGDSVRSLFVHELGHHVQWKGLKPAEFNDITSRRSKFAPKISGYANASGGEYIAESFVAYMKGERDILDPEFIKIMDSKRIQPIKPAEPPKPKVQTYAEKIQPIREEFIAAKTEYDDINNKIERLEKEIAINRQRQRDVFTPDDMVERKIIDRYNKAANSAKDIAHYEQRVKDMPWDQFYKKTLDQLKADKEWHDRQDPKKIAQMEKHQMELRNKRNDIEQQIQKQIADEKALIKDRPQAAAKLEPIVKKAGKVTIDQVKNGKLKDHEDKLKTLKSEYETLGDQANQIEKQYGWRAVLLHPEELPPDVRKILDDYSDKQKEYNNFYRNSFRKRTQLVKETLSEVREMGSHTVDMNNHIVSKKSSVKPHVLDAYDKYPTEWVEKSVKRSDIELKKVSRGYHQDGRPTTIAISGSGYDDMFETAIHELGHRMERAVPIIRDLEEIFYNRRTQGEKLEWLGDGYKKSEKTRKDNFIDKYMGKDYGGECYELVSMGFQFAYCEPENLMDDPDMAQWIYGILTLI